MQGYRHYEWSEVRGTGGDPEDMVDMFGDPLVALGGYGEDGTIAGADFVNAAHNLRVEDVLGHKGNDRGVGIDEGDGAVLELGGRQALGVDIADLFEFEGALVGERLQEPATDEEEAAVVRVMGRNARELLLVKFEGLA